MKLKPTQYLLSGIAQAHAENVTLGQLSSIACIIDEEYPSHPLPLIGPAFDAALQAQVALNNIRLNHDTNHATFKHNKRIKHKIKIRKENE